MSFEEDLKISRPYHICLEDSLPDSAAQIQCTCPFVKPRDPVMPLYGNRHDPRLVGCTGPGTVVLGMILRSTSR